jgi:hypothetical protein
MSNRQHYLLTESTGNASNSQNPDAWLGLIANANDIIEYNGARWIVAFDSQNQTEAQYVTNLTTSIQYKWAGTSWVKSIDGLYQGGSWNLVL